MNKELNTTIKDKKKTFILISLLIVSFITILLIFLFIFNKKLSSNLDENMDIKELSSNNSEAKSFDIYLDDLKGDYSGIRENIDGSIDAIFLQIIHLNKDDNSFEFVLNIGTTMKYTGIGIYSLDKIIKSDILGNLACSKNENNKIILQSLSDKSNSKYKLIKE